MGLYRQKGSKIWWFCIWHEGKRIRRSTRTSDKKLAEAILGKVKTMLIEETWFDVDRSRMKTLMELRGRYLRERSSRKAPKSLERDRTFFGHFLDFFGNCTLDKIKPSRINQYKEHRLESVCSQTVVRELGTLRNAFNVAIKEWEWCRDNPVSRVSMPKLPPGRVRHLSRKELFELLNAAEGWLRPAIEVAVYTGMRQGNLLALTWSQVDLEARRITLDETKNGERQVIPINNTLYGVFTELSKVRLLGSNLVFHREGRHLQKVAIGRALKRACSTVGIEDFRFHDLRHTFASLLIETGEDLYTVQRLLGHKDARMTQRYAHLKYEKLASAVGSLDVMAIKTAIVGENKGATSP